MEDKTFELLTRMYSEFSSRFDGVEKDIKGLKSDVNGLKSDVNGLKNDVNGLKSDVNGLKNDVNGLKSDVTGLKNDVVRLENKLDNNSKALFDGYRQTFEEVAAIKKTVNEISAKVDKQDVEIRVIKGGAANA